MAKKKASKGAIVHVVLDKSGSMQAIAQATRDGVNRFIDETADADPAARFSLTQFDTSVHRAIEDLDIKDVSRLDGRSYRPGGGTALLDAVGTAVSAIDKLPDKPSKIVVAIVTDGQENSSHEYTREAIRSLVAEREKEGWQFLFLGANIDAFAEAGQIGVAAAATRSATFVPDAVGATAAYNVMAASTGSYLRGHSTNTTMTQAQYDSADKSLRYGPKKGKDTNDTVDVSNTTK